METQFNTILNELKRKYTKIDKTIEGKKYGAEVLNTVRVMINALARSLNKTKTTGVNVGLPLKEKQYIFRELITIYTDISKKISLGTPDSIEQFFKCNPEMEKLQHIRI